MSSRPAATLGVRRIPAPVTDPPYDDQVTPSARRLPRQRSGARGEPSRLRRPGAGTEPETAQTLPDPRRWCPWFARMVVEVLYGQRAIQQLLRWTSEDVYDSLADRAVRRPRSGNTATPSVRSIRACNVRDGLVEAAVVLQSGQRARALAIRLEAHEHRWLCTALELV